MCGQDLFEIGRFSEAHGYGYFSRPDQQIDTFGSTAFAKNCRNEASPLRVYYTFERLGSAGGRTRCNPGAQPPGHLPEQCEGYHPGNDRPVRGGPAALAAARRARKRAVTREPAAGTSYLLCTDPTGCAGLSRTPPGG